MNTKPKWRPIQKHAYAIMSVVVILGTCFLVSDASGVFIPNFPADATIGVNRAIRRTHINDMRTKVLQKRNGCDWPCGYANDATPINFGPVVAAETPISKVHINQLRFATRELYDRYRDGPGPAGIQGGVATNSAIRVVHITNLRAAINTAEYCGDSICQDQLAGARDGRETCALCFEDCSATCPTCTDGFLNGNETGIDCGGPDCPPCFANCSPGNDGQGGDWRCTISSASNHGDPPIVGSCTGEGDCSAVCDDGNLIYTSTCGFCDGPEDCMIGGPTGDEMANCDGATGTCVCKSCAIICAAEEYFCGGIIGFGCNEPSGPIKDCNCGGCADCCCDMGSGATCMAMAACPLAPPCL